MLNVITGLHGGGVPASTNNYESIATVTVGSGGTSFIEFTSIPSTYTHLQIRGIAQMSRATYGIGDASIQLNSDTGFNYSYHGLYGDGSSAAVVTPGAPSTSMEISEGAAGTNTGGTFGASIVDILDYKDTNKYKTIRTLSGVDINGTIAGYGGRVGLWSGNWRSTSAVTSIKINPNYGTWQQYTTFALYGVK